jgi:cell division protein FtsL
MAIEVHFEKHINNLNLVREADTNQRRDYVGVTCLFGAFLVCLLFYGWQHYRWMQNGYRIEAALKQKAELDEAGRTLRLERASLRSDQRIDQIAEHDLGMVIPKPGQMVIFTADAPMTIPKPATPQQIQQQQEQLAAMKAR